VISTAAADVYGRHPIQTAVSHFRTVDTAPPTIATVSPANLAVQVSPATTVTVTFSEPLSATTSLASLVSLTGPSGAIAGTTVLASTTVAVFTPAAPLGSGFSYTVTVNGAVDLSGNRQTIAFQSSFATPATIGPVMHLDLPVKGAILSKPRP
jgi:hypothetical protein